MTKACKAADEQRSRETARTRGLAICAALIVLWSSAPNAVAQSGTPVGLRPSLGTQGAPETNGLPPPTSSDVATPKPAAVGSALPAGAAKSAEATGPTLTEMIGQMVMVGFLGATPGYEQVRALRADIKAGRVGSVILMDRNLARNTMLKRLVSSLHAAAEDRPKLLVGIDQEGGAVQRLRRGQGVARYPSAWLTARGGNLDRARQTYELIARDLKRRGINFNFGPVLDLRINQRNPIIARMNRSFGRNPENVGVFARIFVDAHRKYGVLTSAKHFPGHGSSLGDSHEGFVDITRTWKDKELEPYRLMRQTGHLDTVMVGHLFHRELTDGDKLPATLSKVAIAKTLRERVGFEGVVITDDLSMGAIKRNYSADAAI
ncbi:MAG: glycoside hydrolase family 3 N-terminal domain-containing protein, partial [Pseudomonadota bacterium]